MQITSIHVKNIKNISSHWETRETQIKQYIYYFIFNTLVKQTT